MRKPAAALFIVLVAFARPGLNSARADVILQHFESRWETIEHRLPDIFAAGYAAFWLPPPGKADTGAGSVGYDVYNLFDLGDRNGSTQYGTRAYLQSLIRAAHRADMQVYADLVLNHNGFRDHSTPGFESGGSYPGLVVSLPGDSFGDYHDPFAGGRYDERLAGLIDIAQEKNHVFIRHPAFADAANIPNEPIVPENRALYPDQGLAANALGIHPFNLSDPQQGDPRGENATGLLLRHAQWMLEVIGVDGFRIDAAKHIPEWFFNDFFDATVWQRGRANAAGFATTPFSFGEVYDGNWGLVAGYIRKDGFGNRDALDFPLYFSLYDELNANGFGAWSDLLSASIDGSDGNLHDGSRGVGFVSSHDLPPPADDNLAYAYLLTHTGYPIVYFNPQEFGNRPFPKLGRGDALGGASGTLITTLVDIHNEYSRGAFILRQVEGDVLVYERDNVLLVGLNDNADASSTFFDQRNVQTNFAPGTRLHELTGNAADAAIDPFDQIAEVLVVGGDSRVDLRVPRNVNRRGYVMYGPANPHGSLGISPSGAAIPADGPSVPAARRRTTVVPIVTADSFTITLQTTDADAFDPDEDDNALFMLDGGGDYNGNGVIDYTIGVAGGFEEFLTAKSPLDAGGSGVYQQVIDGSGLEEGYHFLKVIAFRHRTGGEPIFQTFPLTFYLDREPPPIDLVYPPQTGNNDITSMSYEVVVQRLDQTANNVHVFFDQKLNTNVLPLVGPANQMTRVDADEFRRTWTGIVSGNHTVIVVAYEESGNVSITRYAGIHAQSSVGAGPGDTNRDGVIDVFDIAGFIAALTSTSFDPTADLNGDGFVDAFDIAPFIAVLAG